MHHCSSAHVQFLHRFCIRQRRRFAAQGAVHDLQGLAHFSHIVVKGGLTAGVRMVLLGSRLLKRPDHGQILI